MKTISTGLQFEVTRSSARIATCLLLTRSDSQEYGFTTNTKTLTIGGVTYWPGASFNPSDVASANNMDTDNVTVEFFLDSEAFTEDDLRASRWDGARFRIFQVNWADLSQGDRKLRTGWLGKCVVKASTVQAELLGLANAYSTGIRQVTQQLCRNNLGDTKCGVQMSGSPTRTVTGTFTDSEDDYFTLADTSRTEVDEHFSEGRLTIHYTSGDLQYEVKSYLLAAPSGPTVGKPTVVTKTPIAYLANGVTYTMEQGCRRRLLEDCVATFNNGRRFNGEPWLRGQDALLQVGRSNS